MDDKTVETIFKILNNKKNKKIEIVPNLKVKKENKKKDNVKNKLLNHFGLDNSYTEVKHKVKYDSFKDNTYPKQDYNFSMDLLFLPTAKFGFKYLVVVVDNWSNEIDFEPIKDKNPITVLNAFKKIVKRPFLDMPYASIRIDSGTEFKGEFKRFFHDNNILLRVAIAGRHKQNIVAESAIRLISFLLINYMNVKELERGEPYKNWTDMITDEFRKILNNLRKIDDVNPHTYLSPSIIMAVNKYNIGDLVVHRLEKTENILGVKNKDGLRRIGDFVYSYNNPKKIEKVLYYPNNIRYILEGSKNVSYTEDELLLYKEIKPSLKNI